jgi:diguanylate cyclase (GGDEF)-like protein/PAS domain S-box-containing protein
VGAEHMARAESSLWRSEERLRTTLETANDAYIELDATGHIMSWNSQAEAVFGWSRAEVLGRDGETLIVPEALRNSGIPRRGLEELGATGRAPVFGEHFEFDAQHRDGHVFPVDMAFWRTRDPDGVRFHAFVHDVSERKATEAAVRRSHEDFAMLFARHPHPMWVWDLETRRFVEVNEAALAQYGYTRDEFLSMTIDQIRPSEDMGLLLDHLALTRHDVEFSADWQHQTRGVWRHRTKEGSVFDVDGATHRLTFNGRDCVLVMVQDVSERQELERELRHQASHDSLTGLANRSQLIDRTATLLTESQGGGPSVTAFFLDLDNFKEVNDSFGHIVGDELLQSVAIRLFSGTESVDLVGRLGGDEFVVLVTGLSSGDDREKLAQQLMRLVRATPFYLDGRNVTITASIGIASGETLDATDLLRNADVALYQAKARGKNCAALFVPEMQSAVHRRLEMAMDLQRALAEDQLELHYQPVMDLSYGSIRGVEALLRWHHPTLGWVSPERFIPLAEEIGAIDEIGLWVLERACRDGADWRRDHPWMSVAINVSGIQLANDGFVTQVADAIGASGLAPDGVVLELTESILMEDANATVRRLEGLKAMGLRLAIDDFGTGFSSLSYLRQFPVDILKIDRSFVSTVTTSVESAALVRTMIKLAQTLGLEVVAEGIETPEQLHALQEKGCGLGQGFHFGPARPKQAIDERLEAVKASPWSAARR